jgi:hypothetical protein
MARASTRCAAAARSNPNPNPNPNPKPKPNPNPYPNQVRGGSKEAALRLDAAVHEVQHAHPNYVRVDNSTDFEGKLRRATQAVLQKLGLPP